MSKTWRDIQYVIEKVCEKIECYLLRFMFTKFVIITVKPTEVVSFFRSLQRLILGHLMAVKDLPATADLLRERMPQCEIALRKENPS